MKNKMSKLVVFLGLALTSQAFATGDCDHSSADSRTPANQSAEAGVQAETTSTQQAVSIPAPERKPTLGERLADRRKD